MATKIEGHTFTKPKSKYPWHDWTDGGQWKIFKDEDYHISTYNMQISLHGRAQQQGLTVKSNSFTDQVENDHGWLVYKEGLIFQFSDE